MKQFARFSGALVSLIVIAGSIYGIANRQQILDFLALRNYTPSDRVVSLADNTTMKEGMRRVFYVNHPALNDKSNFRKNCPANEQSIVLGCYVERDGIFLLDVQDERLNGVVEVTAAHEALHAAYDRLSSGERKHIDQLTSDFYNTLTDERVRKTVERYREKDASVVPNELHSILGTEMRNLTPELEAYYAQYFNNRIAVVDYSEKYEQTFVDLTNQVEQYDEQLKELKQTIESNQVEIEGQNKELEQQKTQLDALINSGKVSDYNNQVPKFNQQVNSYNSLISRTRNLIAQYNEIVEKRNDIATAEQELIKAINSNVIPAETQ